jgi:hypothetical protein
MHWRRLHDEASAGMCCQPWFEGAGRDDVPAGVAH